MRSQLKQFCLFTKVAVNGVDIIVERENLKEHDWNTKNNKMPSNIFLFYSCLQFKL